MTNFNELPLSEKLTQALRGDIVVTDSGARLPVFERGVITIHCTIAVSNMCIYIPTKHITDIIRPEPETKAVPEIVDSLCDFMHTISRIEPFDPLAAIIQLADKLVVHFEKGSQK